jgi:lysosomal acid lipase/cholesteryl ester hydrolase
MINIRGNQYSKKHTTLDSCTGCSEYWDFTHHHSAVEDYPVTIDYILETTGFENIFFVGYSMGTTQYLILLSERPEYNEKIRAGILLGPTAFGGHAKNPMIVASPYAELIGTFITKLGFQEFMPNFLEIKT